MMKMPPEPSSAPTLGPGVCMALWETDDPALSKVASILAGWFGLKLLDAIPATEHGLGTILLLCRAPSEYICRALGQGEDTTATLISWQAKVRPVLTLKRHKRDQTHLVDIEALCRDPATFLHHFGLPAKDGAISALSALADPAPDPILQILAQQTLHADIVCRALASEFDAVAANLQADDPQGSAALDVLAQAYRRRQDEQKELHARTEENTRLETELEEKTGQCDTLSAETERLRQELHARTEENTRLETVLEEKTGQCDTLSTETERLRQEIHLLRSQQQSMYEQMETLYAEKTQAEQRLVQVNNGLESSQAQIRALQDERQRFRNQIASRDNDIEGLRNRMAIKEKTLQKTGHMLLDLEQTKVALEQDNAARQHVTETLREEIASFEQNQKKQAERIGTLEAEIHRILNSRSYRLMAPLRHLRATLKGKKGD